MTPRLKKWAAHGFSLLELLIVAVIVGILATASLVSWAKAIEQSKGRDAEATLQMIFEAEQEYAAHEGQGQYTADLSDPGPLIPKYLPENPNPPDIQIPENPPIIADWRYAINLINGGAGFLVTATRQAGRYAGQRRTINDRGTLTPWPP